MRLINLDDAVKALEQAYPNDGQMSCHDAVAVIGTVPTIEERNKGKWEMKPDPFGFFHDIPVCPECGCTTKMREKTKYCPNCGADLRG